MEKIISYLLLCLSLLLLTLAQMNQWASFLVSLPFSQEDAISFSTVKKTYRGSDFSISSNSPLPAKMNAKAYCLMDGTTKQVLYGSHYNEKMPMASTTKIMTCIIALENCDLNTKVTFSSYAASMPDVQLNAVSGDSFYLKDLLYSLMLESHNDTAVAIAEHIGKSVKGFACLMNNKAKELGCHNTHFVTPNGLDHKKHYTTAKELCMIGAYAMKNKQFQKIIKTPSHHFANCQKTRQYTVHNHDAFLTGYSGSLGIKTGFTGNAGYCFCGAAKRNNQLLISSVLACGWPPHKTYKWSDTKQLMDYGFGNFKTVTLPALPLKGSFPVTGGNSSRFSIKRTIPQKITVSLSAKDTVTERLTIPHSITAPIRTGDIVAYEKIYINRKLYGQYPIIAKAPVAKRDLTYYGKLISSLFFFAVPAKQELS